MNILLSEYKRVESLSIGLWSYIGKVTSVEGGKLFPSGLDTRHLSLFFRWLNNCLLSQADQISDRVNAKFLHDTAAVNFNGFFGNVKL